MKILVTGASGHLGNNLVRALLARGDDVRVTSFGRMESLAGLPVETVPGDVLNPREMRAAVDGIEVVYHLAALITISGDADGLVRRVNVEGPGNVARACLDAHVRRMIHVSSIHAFDPAPYDQPLDETRRRVGPSAPVYERSKSAGEDAVREVARRGLDAVLIHPTGIIGPNDFMPSHVGQVLLDMARRKYPIVPRGGFDWVDVRDVVAGLIEARERGRPGENYILSGHWNSLLDLSRLVDVVTGVRGAWAEIPLSVAYAASYGGLALARLFRQPTNFTPEAMGALWSNRCVSSGKAARELGHSARPASETVRDTCAWFAARGMMPQAVRPTGARTTQELAS